MWLHCFKTKSLVTEASLNRSPFTTSVKASEHFRQYNTGMEEDSCRPFMFYSSSYVNDHVGFCGSIKQLPSDFVVTEIDTSGQLVNEIATDHKSKETSPEQLKICQQDCKRPQLSSSDLCIEEECCSVPDDSALCAAEGFPPSASGAEDFEDSNVVACQLDKVATLDSLLDDTVREQLRLFACNVKDAWKSKSEPALHPSDFSLGLILDKRIRASLHCAIRQQYPCLITTAKRGEIVVKANQAYQELCHLVSEEEACGFLKFLDARIQGSKFAFRPDGDKEHRKKIHHFISKKFGKMVETKSFPDPQQNAVVVVRFHERYGSRKRTNADRGEKQEIYTDFSYAGIKDKKAITYQAMVVKKVTPKRLKELAKSIEKKGICVANVRSASQPLRLGQLQGNHFSIILRNLKQHSNDYSANLKERILEAIENVKKNGFINYYGPQRFGQGQNIQTDKIGLALLKEELVKAVKLFFTPEDTDEPVNKAKKYFLQTEDAKGALAMLPDFKIREKMLLRALNRYGINQEGCCRGWLSIPHSMRILYVHAYCSKIWNEAASYRIKTYGTKVMNGDLIFAEESAANSSQNGKVHVVTFEEEMANKYSINEIILPMVGYNIQYPANKVGEWYHERLARDGLQACTFRLPALQLNVPGCYRHILKYPHNLSYSFLKDKENKKVTGDSPVEDSVTSLCMSFWLDPSCYATVCLGEIMKCDI
ncbi:pseudouridylate synthase PUS7L isoform X2 [Sphaerodactylus townsendi]|nr:pseudouridylate synthase PUS7L isoform X2 [Sphaerodactylus townsendi]